MKLLIDEKYNIGYLYLNEAKKNNIVETKEMEGINIDFAKDGSIVGIEFLDVKDQLKNLMGKKKISFAFQNLAKMKEPKILQI